MSCQNPMLKETEWGVQIGPITRVLSLTSLVFW